MEKQTRKLESVERDKAEAESLEGLKGLEPRIGSRCADFLVAIFPQLSSFQLLRNWSNTTQIDSESQQRQQDRLLQMASGWQR